jgi:hypothetical protein
MTRTELENQCYSCRRGGSSYCRTDDDDDDDDTGSMIDCRNHEIFIQLGNSAIWGTVPPMAAGPSFLDFGSTSSKNKNEISMQRCSFQQVDPPHRYILSRHGASVELGIETYNGRNALSMYTRTKVVGRNQICVPFAARLLIVDKKQPPRFLAQQLVNDKGC